MYVSGGQAVINPFCAEIPNEAVIASELGPNPYKGLQAFHEKGVQAFHESDQSQYFGRSAQIKDLWRQLRDLYEKEESTRFLSIYGPSSSGKSSLVRAELIPELAARSIPGSAQARITVLKPEIEPLQSLSKVMALIAGNGLSQVKKTREFSGKLALPNKEGNTDEITKEAYRTCEKYGWR